MSKKYLRQFDDRLFRNHLIQWYEQNKRTLPWRKTKEPYYIWISEVMLQQTQVETVIPYYERFIKKFPTVFHLANASEQTVLKMWEGLGYYSRARYLHEAAKDIVEKYDGKIPNEKAELKSLKGIGPYTQGAILSIAFNRPEPAVDGNVMRVLSRILHIEEDITKAKTKTLFEKLARELISKKNPSSFNQGLMELGALICTPQSPLCLHCPVRAHCRAFEKGIQAELPIRRRAKKQRIEPYIVLVIKDKNSRYLIEKRPSDGLLADMWQFPMVSVEKVGIHQVEAWVKETYGLDAKLGEKIGEVKHIFSHKIWELTVYKMSLDSKSNGKLNEKNVSNEQLVMKTMIDEANEVDKGVQKRLHFHSPLYELTYVSEQKEKETEPKREAICFEPFERLNKYPFSVSHLNIQRLLEKRKQNKGASE